MKESSSEGITDYTFQDEDNPMLSIISSIKDPAKENEILSKLLVDGLKFNQQEFLLEMTKDKSK